MSTTRDPVKEIADRFGNLVNLFLPEVRKATGLPEGDDTEDLRAARLVFASEVLLPSASEGADVDLPDINESLMVKDGMANHGDPGDEHAEPKMTARIVTTVLVTHWLMQLADADDPKTAKLDGCMFPSGASYGDLEQLFSFPGLEMTAEEAKSVLAAVRRGLPAGQVLPKDAAAIFSIYSEHKLPRRA
jgi:hypothetical protein